MLSGLPDEARDDSTDRLAKSQNVVFSRTLKDVSWPNTRVSGELLDEARSLKADSDVMLRTVGSLSVVQQLLDAGLVDRLRLMRFPLIAGPAGREAAFAGMASADLDSGRSPSARRPGPARGVRPYGQRHSTRVSGLE